MASTVTAIGGSVSRIGFALPAAVPGGNYLVSVGGATAEGATFATAACSALTIQAPDNFVRASGGQLTLNGGPFRFGGANHVAAMFSSRSAVDQVLQMAADNHYTVLRVWGFVDIGNADHQSRAACRYVSRAPVMPGEQRGESARFRPAQLVSRYAAGDTGHDFLKCETS